MAWDVALWGLLAVCVVYGDRLAPDVSDASEAPAPWWLTATGTAALALAVGLARRWPLAGWLVTAVLGLAASPALFTVSYGPALAALSCVLGRRAEGVRPALLAFAGTAGVGVAGVLLRTGDTGDTGDEGAPSDDPLLGCLVMVAALVFGAVFPWVVGRYRRQHRALVAAGWERAERLEREHRVAAERARLRERARIAQDMHDALGHELSLIALRAGALQVAPGLSTEHRASAARLRGAAAEATDRLREIIGVLRDPVDGEGDEGAAGAGASAPLAPWGESVAGLVERAVSAGMRVRLLDGPGRPARGVGRVAYRVVQEGLTNAAKHAPGAEVTVALRRSHEERGEDVTVTVTSTAPPDAPVSMRKAAFTGGAAGPARPGSGLAGLRERVRLVGGELTAGPRADGGFGVEARIPAGAADAAGAAGRGWRGHGQSAAGHQFARQRRAARRAAALSAAGAGSVAAVVVAAVFAWYAYTATHSVLEPAAYERLRLGEAETDVRAVLPVREVTDAPTERGPVRPQGARCAYYRVSGDLFTGVDDYRLCFRAGRLVDKALIRDVLSRAPATSIGSVPK